MHSTSIVELCAMFGSEQLLVRSVSKGFCTGITARVSLPGDPSFLYTHMSQISVDGH